ncbi:hypothetical protein [Pseudomonas sp. MN1F]|uniref:hypothetical protein n=1 Tax=Pseudomonas sp. MN1F TaxID=1366632 RepID=UPI00128EFB2C|nr:hypothetical protein [Pseudomonas sp. MN1F]MQG91469.1 hypothetical protein [Pseudomonas sp. MN1F]
MQPFVIVTRWQHPNNVRRAFLHDAKITVYDHEISLTARSKFMKHAMPFSLSRRTAFNVALCLTVVLGFVLVYHLGFRAMSLRTDATPERLRDFTFPVWQSVPWSQHGFLTFLNADAYSKHEAYANHSTLYLIFMRGLHQLQQWVPMFTMRMTGATLAMLASLGVVWFAIRNQLASLCDWRRCLLVLAAFLYFLTSPGFWISLGKFNVDNGFVFVFPLVLLTSILLERNGARGRSFWISGLALCVVMPMASALFSFFMLGMALLVHGADRRRVIASVVLMAVSVVLYLQPVLVAKVLGYSSENSTWLFRSGLDGDMRFYGNFIDSVVAPQFNRPWYMIAIPAILLIIQLGYGHCQSSSTALTTVQAVNAQGMLQTFSVYLLMLLFWPQAVSIHPYLYDALLVGPIVAWTVINFATRPVFGRHLFVWLLVLAFLIQFNLTKISQAGNCAECFFPTWGMLGERVG